MVELDLIRELVRLMSENDLAEIRLRDGVEQVSLRRRCPEPTPAQPLAAQASFAPTGPPLEASAPKVEPPPPVVDLDAGLIPIASPMVGTFYSSASPQSPPFVAVGAVVGPSSVVCIVEAMKVFNEIKAETSGTIAKVLVGNGMPVEYGQPMFMVRPNA